MVSSGDKAPAQPLQSSLVQEPLFAIVTVDGTAQLQPRTVEEVSRLAHEIGEAVVARPQLSEEEDATDRWLEERGGGTDRSYPRAVDPPHVRSQTPKKRKLGPPARLRDGDSGLDPDWNVHPVHMSAAEAAEYRRGVDTVRAALAARPKHDIDRSNIPEQHWIAPKETVKNMLTVMNDVRAGFVPKTEAELTEAKMMIERLHPNQPRDSVGIFMNSLFAHIKSAAMIHNGTSEAKALVVAQRRMERIAAHSRSYADNSLAVQADLKELNDYIGLIKQGGVKGLYDGSSLAEVLSHNPDVARGVLAVVQEEILRQTVMYDRAPINANPFRNLGSRFDKVAQKLTQETIDTGTKQGQILAYVEQRLAGITVGQAAHKVFAQRGVEDNRFHFWQRISNAIPEKYKLEVGIN